MKSDESKTLHKQPEEANIELEDEITERKKADEKIGEQAALLDKVRNVDFIKGIAMVSCVDCKRDAFTISL